MDEHALCDKNQSIANVTNHETQHTDSTQIIKTKHDQWISQKSKNMDHFYIPQSHDTENNQLIPGHEPKNNIPHQ